MSAASGVSASGAVSGSGGVSASGGAAAPVWAAAVARVAPRLARSVEIARAGGSTDGEVAEALRAVGPAFERWLERQPRLAATTELTDRWALGWAETVVRLVAARRFGASSLARWVVSWVVPAVSADLSTASPRIVDDLVEAAGRIGDAADVTVWARGLERGSRAWPVDRPFGDDDLRRLGAVAAWRAGHVRLRATAARLAADLPTAVAVAVLDTDDVRAALSANAARPGDWPGMPGDRQRIGAFRGFGGAWLRPPVVLGGDGHRWSVRSGDEHYTVLTDAFGVAVLPATTSDAVQDTGATDATAESAAVSASAPLRQSWWTDHGADVTGAARARGQVLVSHAGSHRLTLSTDPSTEPAAAEPAAAEPAAAEPAAATSTAANSIAAPPTVPGRLS